MTGIITIIFCAIMGILSFLGIWQTNRFGLSGLWLLLGLAIYMLEAMK